MQSKRTLSHPYIIPFLAILITIIFLFFYFAFEEYNHNRKKILDNLTSEADRIETKLNDIIDHSAFVMKVIIMQIKPNYEDKEYIYNIINKYAVNPGLNNILSWLVFSWVDKDQHLIVDSVAGVNARKKDLSNKDYIQKSKIYPKRMHLGEPIYGFTSQRYSVPAGIGAYDGNKYIGTLTLNFDLVQISKALADSTKNSEVYFALLDKNFNIIMQSPNNIRKIRKSAIKTVDIKKFIAEKKISMKTLQSISQINLIQGGMNHYLYKVRDYPYAIYLRYDNIAVRNAFWKDITFRVIEIIVIGFVALTIVGFVYNREKNLRRKAEHAKQQTEKALQAKTDFLAYTAHELRSPLAYIISSSEMMIKEAFGKFPQKYHEYVKNINGSSKELLEFIDDLLSEMRAKYSKFDSKESDVDVRDILMRSVRINNINYNHKINFEFTNIENMPLLRTDPKRLLQIFNNIISNAIKYSKEGTILKITSESDDEGLKLIFKDQGFGMSSTDIDISRIKFGVVENNREKNTKSVGLGIPLVIELVETLGGKLDISSKIGDGTKVILSFPKSKLRADVSRDKREH